MQCPEAALFIEQSHIAVGNYMQALCLNRARVRRRLGRGLEDWQRMRVHASNADHCDASLCFLASPQSGWSEWASLHLQPNMPGPCGVRLPSCAENVRDLQLLVSDQVPSLQDYCFPSCAAGSLGSERSACMLTMCTRTARMLRNRRRPLVPECDRHIVTCSLTGMR